MKKKYRPYIKYYQEHLNGLVNAFHCLDWNSKNPNNKSICPHPNCSKYQILKEHISMCTQNENCFFNLCKVAKELLIHYNYCVKKLKNYTCELCKYITAKYVDTLYVLQKEQSPEKNALKAEEALQKKQPPEETALKDEEELKKEKIRYILERILHAKQCFETNGTHCNKSSCIKYIEMLKHRIDCDGNCNNMQCNIVRDIYCHWMNCDGCSICNIFRRKLLITTTTNIELSNYQVNGFNNSIPLASTSNNQIYTMQFKTTQSTNVSENNTELQRSQYFAIQGTNHDKAENISEQFQQSWSNSDSDISMMECDVINQETNHDNPENDQIQKSNVKIQLSCEPMQDSDLVVDNNTPFLNQQSNISESTTENIPNITTDAISKIFNPEELKKALMPTLDKLIQQDPESLPFRTPVDPISLGIPDYFKIVKKPMDLGTVKNNLITGKYSDPWEYVDDVWLMFENAWLYNRKTSTVYRYCIKLSEVFEQEIDPVMQALGYCCGHKYTFNPQILCCYSKQLCTIPRDAKYYSYQNTYTFCQKCFNNIAGDTVTLGDTLQSQTQIKKDQFKKMKNDHLELEPFVDCNECGRKQHQICVLHLENIWPGGFVCDNCIKNNGSKRKENKFSAKRLPTTKLGIYIETRVNNFLKKKEAGAGEVHIRVVSSSDKIVEVKPGMRRRFVESNEFCGEFPYRTKALFAFQEIDGVDVCFFGMHVQEYGSECPKPNTRRVYIAYLDSVHFFKPRQYRTAVYHEILLGYMDYVKQLGFTMAHIWACPPSKGDDYIFHCHPPDQKIPKPQKLQEWYKKMLDKGMIEKTIQDYKDILKQAMEDKLLSAADLPYFEGDFWPNDLEACIKKFEEEEKRKQAEAVEAAANALSMFSVSDNNEAAGDNKNKGQNIAKNTKPPRRKSIKKPNELRNKNDLITKIFSTMEKHKEAFFVVQLHSAQSAATLRPIEDPDPLMNCDLMDGRDALLTMARDKYYEFASLRRAQFSTLNILYELHNQGQDKFVYTCNNCKTAVETRYHCIVCYDFDLCIVCKDKVEHSHKMEKLNFDLVDDAISHTDMKQDNPQNATNNGTSSVDIKQVNLEEARNRFIKNAILILEHACQCRDGNCKEAPCKKMKRYIEHTKTCFKECKDCNTVKAICRSHAEKCKRKNCQVLCCTKIKEKLLQKNNQDQLYTLRRFHGMNLNCTSHST